MKRLNSAMLRIAIPLAALIAAAAPAGARTIGGWEVAPSDDFCSMTATFTDDVRLTLIWSPKSEVLSFLVTSIGWDQLRGTDHATVQLNFDGRAKYTEWLDERARVVSINSTIEGVTGNWGPEHSRELADSLTSSNAVAIRIGDDKIGDYTLDSTGEAYQELIRCGRSLPSAGT